MTAAGSPHVAQLALQLVVVAVLLLQGHGVDAKLRRQHHHPHAVSTRAARHCREPPNLRDELAAWMRESLQAKIVEDAVEDWTPPSEEPPICSKSPRAEGEASVMQRALCPWEAKVNYEETREPKMIAESTCLCRRSRGSSGAFCVPIIREVPVLRRISCDMTSGQWKYVRSTQPITVGCHSVLPRTQRAVALTHFASGSHPV